jgi:putative Holliday junction resolvase
MKVLAVDYGLKRVGLASGDTSSRIAFPKAVLLRKNDKVLVDDILKICSEDGYEIVVFGLPFNMDGADGLQCDFTRNFISLFTDEVRVRGLKLEIKEVDERLSSFEAEKYDGSKEKVDMMAAKIILERYFELG